MFSDYTRKHQPSQFAYLATLPSKPVDGSAEAPADLIAVTLEQAGLVPDDPIALLIVNGDDIKRPIGTENAAYPSRSEVVFNVSIDLVRRGFPPEIVAGLLLNQVYKISASILEKPNARKYAWRQVQRAIVVALDSWPDVTREGKPKASFRNASRCLMILGVELHYDLFRLRITANGQQIQQFAGDMSDDVLAVLRKLATDRFGFDPGKTHIADAAHTLALENAFHPIRDYLDTLKWDGIERLPNLLQTYFGAGDTPLNRAFSVMVPVAAVRRVRVPGTKFDTMLVLEGTQGSGKSTAIKILAGEENFSDQTVIGLDQKVQGELLQGAWLSEVAELSGLRHTEVNALKSFLSRDTDRFRAAYARFTTSYPRQCVFIGTTNDEVYLKDETGNRRFWPVKTNNIDLEGLERDRDQIWAEAAYREAKGEPITLPKDLWVAAADLQVARMPRDPWLDTLSDVTGAQVVNGEWRISTRDLFGEQNLKIPPAQQQDYHAKRLSRVMDELGWGGPKAMKIDGKTQRGYSRPVDPETDDVPPQF